MGDRKKIHPRPLAFTGLCAHQIILILLFDEIMTLAGKDNGTDVKYLGFAGI